MSKDKLISFIIRKQTYKDTKPYLIDILNLKEETVNICIQSIKQILTTQYNAEAKLFAVRFLKDGFEKGNPSFIQKVQNIILPILFNIALDELDQKSLVRYAGSSYTKTQQLAKFKTIMSSLFRMIKECIIKWAEWIPSRERKFVSTYKELQKKKVALDFQYKYFRQQNWELFKEYANKNGVKVGEKIDQNDKANKEEKMDQANKTDKVEKVLNKGVSVSKLETKKSKDPLIQRLDDLLKKAAVLSQSSSNDAFIQLENDFNEAFNNYLQGTKDFNQDFVNKCFSQLQQHKKKCFSKKSASNIKSNESIQKLQIKQMEKINIQKPTPKNQLKAEEKSKKVSTKIIKNNQILSQNKAVLIPEKTQSKKKIEKINNSEKKIEVTISQIGKKLSHHSPIIFDQNQLVLRNDSNVSKVKNQNPASENASEYIKKKEPSKVQNIVNKSLPPKSIKLPESSLSKDPERVNFSDSEYQSQEASQDVIQRVQNNQFKKKYKLNAIAEEGQQFSSNQSSNKKGLQHQLSPRAIQNNKSQKLKSPVKKIETTQYKEAQAIYMESKINKNSVNNRLLQQNKILIEKYETLLEDFDKQKGQKLKVIRQKKVLQQEFSLIKQEEQKMVKRIKASVPMEDYNKLRKQLEEERKNKQIIFAESYKLKDEVSSLKSKIQQSRNRINNSDSFKKMDQVKEEYRQRPVQSRILNQTAERYKVDKISNLQQSPMKIEQLDPDYANNLTHISNMSYWLSQSNINLFKRAVLGLSEMFYRDEYVSIISSITVYTKNEDNFLSLIYNFQFKNIKQINPDVKYKNCQQVDLWIKPLMGSQLMYKQDLIAKLHKHPLRIIKANIKIVQSLSITFLLPFLYYNFLRQQDVNQDQFDEIYSLKSQQLLKSKIIQIVIMFLAQNPSIIKQISDFTKIFKNASISEAKIKCCLSQGISDHIFLVQFQLLKGNKFILKILPIPYQQNMIVKAKELMDNLIFLIG